MTKKNLEDFTKEDQDLGDVAFIETMSHIKNTISEYIDKEEIKHEIWNAVKDGIKIFCEEYYQDIIGEITKELSNQIQDKLTINFDVNVMNRK